MKIKEYIYEGVVEPYYKKTTRADANRACLRRKMRGEYASSTTYSNRNYGSVKRRKRYVDNPNDRPKLTCLVHCPVHSAYECMVLGDFGYKYSKSGHTKY